MNDMMELLADILDLEVSEFSAETALADIEEWDSLAKLSLMAEAKKNFDKMITTDDMNSFKTIQDIIDYLKG